MSKRSPTRTTQKNQATLMIHASLVLVVGLLSGFGLLFALLTEIRLWPFPGLDVTIPGTVRGWSAAHVGGLTNGLLMIAVAAGLPLVSLTTKAEHRVTLALLFTGWANTIFYQFGNLTPNRGLSGDANALGEASWVSVVAFLPAALATVVTLGAVVALLQGALKRRSELG